MAKNKNGSANSAGNTNASSSVDELLLAALERGDDSFETGRYLVTFKDGAGDQGLQSLGTQGMRVADARDFEGQAATLENIGDADAVVFPEIGVALIGGNAAQERSMGAQMEIASDSPIEIIEPEHFVFAEQFFREAAYLSATKTNGNGSNGGGVNEYLRGFLEATDTITKHLQHGKGYTEVDELDEETMVLGATWGLNVCKVPPSLRSGLGIRVAVLDTGFNIGHPDFVGRPVIGATFVGQPVQDLHSHGTHCIGTACGPKSPAGTTPRYGIGYRSSIFAGKVLSNTGSSVGGSVLAGMNWAIANRCPVISMSLGGTGGVQAAYTAAGQAALNNGCLIIAAAGNSSGPTGFPANSPTIMSVASLDMSLSPSSFSNFGKVEIAAPGRDVFSSAPMPRRYTTMSGTSMATPHVAGCAALWAETSPNMRGLTLWRRLQASARRLPFSTARVGAGLVQAP
ncbi:S8 family serine peptidase [Hymenobacter sp. BT188]|uniref:S8 family serine peptidase n=1 Tax=Hymenobacter sp. BT188 TaxID=2763504 RepID=UPI00165173C4|nr:S8 family serine peptidase [Hymenobacter sp. BT188]MBC6605586.1 S8 family serine peptidase [Hymenobacter sp. BT188]